MTVSEQKTLAGILSEHKGQKMLIESLQKDVQLNTSQLFNLKKQITVTETMLRNCNAINDEYRKQIDVLNKSNNRKMLRIGIVGIAVGSLATLFIVK